MISAGDFRNGVTFEMNDGSIVQIIEFQHVKPGKGAAFVRAKIRNVITEAVTETTFNPADKFPTAYIERKEMEYLYNDGELYYFMDMETYETYELTEDQVGFNKYFIVEGAEVQLMFFEGLLLSVSVPEKVELTITETDAAIKGAPSNQTKDAVTETGLSLRVPQFIEPGEKIVVFSTDGKYAGRA